MTPSLERAEVTGGYDQLVVLREPEHLSGRGKRVLGEAGVPIVGHRDRIHGHALGVEVRCSASHMGGVAPAPGWRCDHGRPGAARMPHRAGAISERASGPHSHRPACPPRGPAGGRRISTPTPPAGVAVLVCGPPPSSADLRGRFWDIGEVTPKIRPGYVGGGSAKHRAAAQRP